MERYLVCILAVKGVEYKIFSTVPNIWEHVKPTFDDRLKFLGSHDAIMETMLDIWQSTPGVEVEVIS